MILRSLRQPAVLKLASLLILALPAHQAAAQDAASLSGVRSVYLLPMRGGFEQHLANHLTSAGVFQVVTHPGSADAIFSDHIGKDLERQLEELYPPPASQPTDGGTELDTSERAPSPLSSFSRGRWNIFLISRDSRVVLWSLYQPPRDTTPNALDRNASRVVRQLLRALGPN
jgi:hypothetical protein